MPPTMHAVERLNWRAVRYTDDRFRIEWEGFVQLPGQRRLRSFDNADEADAFCAEQEAAMRERVNPFTCGGPALHYQTGFDAGRLHDWLLDAGIEPPDAKKKKIDWRKWWDKQAKKLSAHQRELVWQALDLVRFHRVVERPASKTVFIVTRREWDYNDNWYYPTETDGTPIEAYSTYEKAEAARARWEQNEMRSWDRGSLEVTTLHWARRQPGDPIPAPHEEVFAEPDDDRLFFEVIEVDLGGPA